MLAIYRFLPHCTLSLAQFSHILMRGFAFTGEDGMSHFSSEILVLGSGEKVQRAGVQALHGELPNNEGAPSQSPGTV